MGYRFIRFELGERRASLVLNRPPLNILNREMLDEVNNALEQVAQAEGCKVLTLRGEGKAFSAGVDVADHTEERVEAMLRSFHNALLKLFYLEVPTIAKVHGHCLGGGLELAMACDLAYASSDATLGQPEITLASFPPFAAAMYPTFLGLRQASELILLGRRVTAERAAEMGLVNAVYEEDALDKRLEEVCSELEGHSRVALKIAKKAMRAAVPLGPTEAVHAAERLYLEELMATEDAKEGIAAFMEKRKPIWRDR
ncbi:MAG: enoyl-CoA hydratase/isomerase family protein [Thermoplasmata archaeon]